MWEQQQVRLSPVPEDSDDNDIQTYMDVQILEAAKNDPNEVLNLLSKGANVHATSGEGEPAICLLVSNENTTGDILSEALQYMKNKTDDTSNDNQKQEALVIALDQKRVQMVQILLDNNAVISQVWEDQEQSLNHMIRRRDEESVRSLLEHGAKVNERDEHYGNTPLDNACVWGLTTIAELLLHHKADINAIDFNGSTPLNTACRLNRKETVQFLLENNADFDQADKDGLTPLHTAAKEGNEQIVLILLEYSSQVNKGSDSILWDIAHLFDQTAQLRKADPDKIDSCGRTPLHTAAKEGNEQIVSMLLEYGVQANAVDDGGWTPLNTAVKEGNGQIVSILLKHSVQVDKANHDGRTPLHTAVEQGNEAIVLMLLELDAKFENPVVQVDKADYDCWTPLAIASAWGYQTIVEDLLKKGANPNNKGNQGWTALHLASAFGQDVIVKKLLEYNTDIDAKADNHCTALHLASQQGYHKVVHALLEEMPTINALDEHKWTPLHCASFCKGCEMKLLYYGDSEKQIKPITPAHDEVVNLLLGAGARTEEKTDKMETALHLATKSQSLKCFQKLLPAMKEYDIAAQDANGATALSLASKMKSPEMVRSLLENGNTADFGIENIEQDVLLWAAETERTHDIVALLSKKGKTMERKDIPDKSSDSALYWAALNGNLDLVWRILSNSAPSEKTNKDRDDAENALRVILSKPKEDESPAKNPNADGGAQRNRGEEREADKIMVQQQKDQADSDTRRNYELILDLIKDPAYVQTSAPSKPCKLPELDKQKKIDEFEAAIVDFYDNGESSGFYQRFRSVKEVIYDKGPEKIMSDAQKWLQDVAEKLKDRVRYLDQDFQFRWIHLPANNLEWMNDLTSRIVYDGKGKEEEDENENEREARRIGATSWSTTGMQRLQEAHSTRQRLQRMHNLLQEVQNEKRKQKKYSDLYNFFRRSWHSVPDASSEFRSMKPGHLTNDELINYHAHAIYMPYLVFSAYPSKKGSNYDKLLSSYKKHEIHGFRTLDESYYNFTPDMDGKKEKDHRNRDQVVTKRIYLGESVPTDQWLLVGVEQLWLWVLDRKTIITSSTHRIDDEESNTVRRAVLKELNNIRNGRSGQSQPRSSMDMSAFIVDICTLRYEREKAINRSIEQFFADAVNDAAVKESVLFQRFTNETEKSGYGQNFIKDAAKLLCEVKDIRDELNMLKSVVRDQEIVQDQVYRLRGNEFATEILEKIKEMIETTDRIHEAVNATLALEQNTISMKQSEEAVKQSEEAVQQGKKLMAFTIATIIFLPMSFLVSLFDIDITAFQHNSSGALQYTPGWIFPILFCVSAIVWLPLIIYALYWNDDSINAIKKLLPGFKGDAAPSIHSLDKADEPKSNVEDKRPYDTLRSKLHFKRRTTKMDEEAR